MEDGSGEEGVRYRKRGFTRIKADLLFLTPACGCAGVHPGGKRELRFWVFSGLKMRDNSKK